MKTQIKKTIKIATVFSLAIFGFATVGMLKPASAMAPIRATHAEQKRSEINNALKDKDYEAWKKAVAEVKGGEYALAQINTVEKFNELVKLHELKQEVRSIKKELGIHPWKKMKEKREERVEKRLERRINR